MTSPTPHAPPPHAPPTGPKRKNIWVTAALAIGMAFVIGQGLRAAGDDYPATSQRSTDPGASEQSFLRAMELSRIYPLDTPAAHLELGRSICAAADRGADPGGVRAAAGSAAVVLTLATQHLCPRHLGVYDQPASVPALAAPPAPSGPVTTFTEGTYEVGVDVEAGKYKTAGPSEPGDLWTGCYYARLSGTDGELGSILANENFEGQNTVTIKSSDVAFEANGDCVWQKVG